MGLLKEFKDFAMRGNVIDMAVGVIIGGAFGKIVQSVVNDIIMPPVSQLMAVGGKAISFKDKFIPLAEPPEGVSLNSLEAAQKAGVPVLAYGSFLQGVVDFVILAFCVFLMVKAMNYAFRRQAEKPAPPPVSPQEKLLTEIRDLLAKQA
jgi:large conductance mechanosensitive channel